MNKTYQVCAPLFCTRCKNTKPRAGGQHVPSDDGLTHKWNCADCLARERVTA